MAIRLEGFLVVLCFFATASSDFFDIDSSTADRECREIFESAKDSPHHFLHTDPEIEKVSFELRKPCTTTEFAVSDTNKLRASPDFNVKLKTVVIVTGGKQALDEVGPKHLFKALHCRGDVNVIVVKTSGILESLDYVPAYRTEILGKYVALGLINLKIPGKDIHLIGHGLGAHVMGSAGRHFAAQAGEKIARITGLDPVGPCFKEPLFLHRLSAANAAFVDIIHSNPGDFGIEQPIGHADFYPNGLDPIPPYCMWDDQFCAHSVSLFYLEESVYRGNENNFMGSRCDAFANLKNKSCTGTKAPMGYAADEKSRGIYFLEVNHDLPFGKNAKDQTRQDLNTCGVCLKLQSS